MLRNRSRCQALVSELSVHEPMFPRRSSSPAWLSFAAAAVAALALSACADGADLPAAELKPSTGPRIHRLGVGDKLKVSVFGEQDLSGIFEVGPTGHLAMPLVGDIAARDKSVTELRDTIASRLSQGYLKSPKVAVEVVGYRPFYVHGEVRSSGEFAFKTGTKLRDAIAVAGGYTYRANRAYVILIREGDPREVKVATAGDVEVQPGDNIRVPERLF